MAKRNYHVEYSESDGEWKLRLTNASRASKTFDSKTKAVREGKRLANNKSVELLVYTKDGRHQETQNYSAVDRAKNR